MLPSKFIKYQTYKSSSGYLAFPHLMTTSPVVFGAYKNQPGLFVDISHPALNDSYATLLSSSEASEPDVTMTCGDIALMSSTVVTLTKVFVRELSIIAKHKHVSPAQFKTDEFELITKDVSNWVSVDFEMFERNQKILLEVGITTLVDGTINTRHLVYQENQKYTNGKYVPDNRDHFKYGSSEILPSEEINKILVDTVMSFTTIIAHSPGVERTNIESIVDDVVSSKLKYIDTERLHSYVHDHYDRAISLTNCLKKYDIENDCSHNGGNDSHRTMQLLMKLIPDLVVKN